MIEPLLARGKSFVIPPKSNRKVQRDFDRDAYKARHLIENFFCKLKQSAPSPPVTTKPPEISSPQFTSRLADGCCIPPVRECNMPRGPRSP